VHDERGIALRSGGVRLVVVDPVRVEGHRRVAEQQRPVRRGGRTPGGVGHDTLRRRQRGRHAACRAVDEVLLLLEHDGTVLLVAVPHPDDEE